MGLDLQPTDFVSGLGRLPNPLEDMQAAIKSRLGNQRDDLVNQGLAAKLTADQAAQQEDKVYRTEAQSVFANPTPRGIASLMGRFPKYGAEVKQAFDLLDADQKQTDLGQLSAVYSYAQAGKFDKAAEVVKRRIDADRAAGQDTSDDEALYEAFASGDPEQQKQAAAQAGLYLATVAGPDKFGATFGALNKGRDSKVVDRFLLDENGNVLFEAPRDPEKPQYIKVQNPDGSESIVAVGGGGGTAPQSGGGTPSDGRTIGGWTPRARNGGDNTDAAVDGKIAGMSSALGISPTAAFPSNMTNRQIAEALTLSEGGAGSLADRNNNPGNLRDPKTLEYRKFASREAGLAAATAQVARNRRRGQNTIQTMVEGLPVGGGAAAQGGGIQPLYTTPGAKAGYRLLTPQEVAAVPGLDPQTAYQISPDNQITAVGGQSRSQLKAWPTTQATSHASNVAAIKGIDAALNLFEPNIKSGDNSPEARKARRDAAIANRAIGFGTGMLGDRFTQMNDPAGTDARSRIGQIGAIIIKDTSGAAVSLAEDQRLAKWVPLVTDSPKVALAKLRNLKRDLETRNQTLEETFSEDQGYRPLTKPGASGFRIVRVRPK